MTSKEVVITIRLQIDADADVRVEVDSDSAAVPEGDAAAPSGQGLPAAVERFVAENAPRSLAAAELEFLRRCSTELGFKLELPATASPRSYLNLFPPRGYGAKRAGVLETRTARVDLYCAPENAEGRPWVETIANNGVPFAVKVYLKGPEAIDEAITLGGIVLEER